MIQLQVHAELIYTLVPSESVHVFLGHILWNLAFCISIQSSKPVAKDRHADRNHSHLMENHSQAPAVGLVLVFVANAMYVGCEFQVSRRTVQHPNISDKHARHKEQVHLVSLSLLNMPTIDLKTHHTIGSDRNDCYAPVKYWWL